MTGDDLEAAEELAKSAALHAEHIGLDGAFGDLDKLSADALALVAEVRRLRKVLAQADRALSSGGIRHASDELDVDIQLALQGLPEREGPIEYPPPKMWLYLKD